jgi:hypothetical protein
LGQKRKHSQRAHLVRFAGCELRSPVEGIAALPGFSLDIFTYDFEGLTGGKPLDSCPLSFKAEAGAVLALRGDPQTCNRALRR